MSGKVRWTNDEFFEMSANFVWRVGRDRDNSRNSKARWEEENERKCGILHVTFVKKSYRKGTLLSFCWALSGVRFIFLVMGIVINLRRRHRTSRIAIGSDLIVSLAPSLEGLTGSVIIQTQMVHHLVGVEL